MIQQFTTAPEGSAWKRAVFPYSLLLFHALESLIRKLRRTSVGVEQDSHDLGWSNRFPRDQAMKLAKD